MAVSLDNLRERQIRGEIEAIQNDSSLDILTEKIEATLKDYGMQMSSYVLTFSADDL
jgi:hypothetical protein